MASQKHRDRFINIPGVLNLRDIGGYPIASQPGRQVRSNLVYRSAAPSPQITQEGISTLRGLGIRHVYDLRSTAELGTLGCYARTADWDGIERVLVPVFRPEDYDPGAVAARFRKHGASAIGFSEGYTEILAAAAHPENESRPYAMILKHLASPATPTALWIHCSAGKDRTAIICALILSLCGVDDDIVAEEYSLSDTGLQSLHGEMIDLLLQKDIFRSDPDEARLLVLTRKENMLAFIDKIKTAHGSVEQCLISLGVLERGDVDQLKSNLIVASPTNMGATE